MQQTMENTLPVGQWVLYRAPTQQHRDIQEEYHLVGQPGRVKSCGDKGIVFVVYHCNGQWHRFAEYTGIATKREDLLTIPAPVWASEQEAITL